MTTIECPWCAEPVELELPTAVEMSCATCQVHVELAADPRPVVAQAA
jgi:endogenous inhibitor of DNA gyrase (YacG/DUF329 family)